MNELEFFALSYFMLGVVSYLTFNYEVMFLKCKEWFRRGRSKMSQQMVYKLENIESSIRDLAEVAYKMGFYHLSDVLEDKCNDLRKVIKEIKDSKVSQ